VSKATQKCRPSTTVKELPSRQQKIRVGLSTLCACTDSTYLLLVCGFFPNWDFSRNFTDYQFRQKTRSNPTSLLMVHAPIFKHLNRTNFHSIQVYRPFSSSGRIRPVNINMQRHYGSSATSSKNQRDEKTKNKKGFRFRLKENKKFCAYKWELPR
jgi:hypothetical protein